jgi:hypothetical protein
MWAQTLSKPQKIVPTITEDRDLKKACPKRLTPAAARGRSWTGFTVIDQSDGMKRGKVPSGVTVEGVVRGCDPFAQKNLAAEPVRIWRAGNL